jgi:hypothetical protein
LRIYEYYKYLNIEQRLKIKYQKQAQSLKIAISKQPGSLDTRFSLPQGARVLELFVPSPFDSLSRFIGRRGPG